MSLSKYGPALVMIVGGAIGLASGLEGCDSLPLPLPIDNEVDPAKTEGSWVIVLEETSERTPAIAKVLTNEAFWSGLVDRGLKRRLLDKDNPDASPYRSIADKHGLPCLILLAPDGTPLHSGPLPETREAMEAIVKEKTGR